MENAGAKPRDHPWPDGSEQKGSTLNSARKINSVGYIYTPEVPFHGTSAWRADLGSRAKAPPC